MPAEQLSNVLGALLDIGDRAKHSGSFIAGRLPEFLYVSWAIFDVIDLLPQQDRVRILEERFRVTDGVGTATDLIVTIKAMNENGNSKYGEFNDESLGALRTAVVGRITQLASSFAIFWTRTYYLRFCFLGKRGDAKRSGCTCRKGRFKPQGLHSFSRQVHSSDHIGRRRRG